MEIKIIPIVYYIKLKKKIKLIKEIITRIELNTFLIFLDK